MACAQQYSTTHKGAGCCCGAGDSQGQYKGVLDCFAKTLRNDGLGAFYNGFLPNWGRLGVYNVVLFLTLEQVLPLGVLHSAIGGMMPMHRCCWQLRTSYARTHSWVWHTTIPVQLSCLIAYFSIADEEGASAGLRHNQLMIGGGFDGL